MLGARLLDASSTPGKTPKLMAMILEGARPPAGELEAMLGA
ncbi:MAG: hypothetical protein ACFBQW_09570 [Sphingomonadaceae bacterium]